jgi:hypothetical protein
MTTNPSSRPSAILIHDLTLRRDRTRARLHADIEAIATRARNGLLPYFERHKYTYKAENGAWIIERRDGTLVDDGALPAWVYDVLHLDVGDGQLLGHWIMDIYR